MWQTLKGSARFKQELQQWVAQGLLTAEQADQLAQQYEVDAPPPWYRDSTFLLRATGLLIGAMGFLLLIAANWEALPLPARVLVGLLPLLAAYATAWHATWLGETTRAELAMIFGTLAFGANLALQAQIFHISAYYPDGLLWWMVGALPVIWYFRSAFLHVIFQGLYIWWLALQNEYQQFSWWSPGLFAAFAYTLYRRPNGLALVVMAVSLFMFLTNAIIATEQLRFWDWDFVFNPIYWAAVGLLYWVGLERLAHQYPGNLRPRLARLLHFCAVGLLFAATFPEILPDLLRLLTLDLPKVLPGLLALALAGYFYPPRLRHLLLAATFGMVAWLLLPGLSWWWGLFPAATNPDEYYVSGQFNPQFLQLYGLLTNLLFLLLAVWRIWAGVRTQTKAAFMSGIFYVTAWALGKYVALVGDYITSSLVLMACGAGLFFINRLWHNRLAKP
ncbi:MAG: DUF2157 domain-containing protein [Bernardetiaceae bacterium]|jgi:uncharacterized membrane protein|nr:DUF2157 domain-containing protein [Bernardetiaceae bacterium]